MHTVATPGIYFRKSSLTGEDYLIEMDLAVSTVIDERCLPIGAITKTDLANYQANWYVKDESDPRYIQGRPFYSTVQSSSWDNWAFYQEDSITIDTPNGKKMYLIDGSFINDYDLVNTSIFVQENDEERVIVEPRWGEGFAQSYDDGFFYITDSEADNPFYEGDYTTLILYAPYDNYDVSDIMSDGWPVISKKGLYALFDSETKYVSGFECGRTEKLSERYIPELSHVILKSSNYENSYKKFKITVDDDGNLTATEVE